MAVKSPIQAVCAVPGDTSMIFGDIFNAFAIRARQQKVSRGLARAVFHQQMADATDRGEDRVSVKKCNWQQ